MKHALLSGGVFALLTIILLSLAPDVQAQEETSDSPFSVGGDLVSSYIWRGSKFGAGPAIQPYVELALGNFAVGGWGSVSFSAIEAQEADLYLSYGFDFGLSLGLTDYYFPGSPYFDFATDSTRAHGFEVNLGYELKGFSLSANYMINEAGGAGTSGGDMYFELGYSTAHFGAFVGAGSGWHTVETDPDESDFNLCNIGITASSEINITDSYALPLSGSLILNPDTEQFYVVVAISF